MGQECIFSAPLPASLHAAKLYDEVPHPALMQYALRQYQLAKGSAKDRQQAAVKFVQTKLQNDCAKDVLPFLRRLSEQGYRKLLASLAQMAISGSGTFPTDARDRSTDIAKLGIVQLASAPDQFRLHSIYASAVLTFLNEDGTLRDVEQLLRPRWVTSPALERLLLMCERIDWYWRSDDNRHKLYQLESVLRDIYLEAGFNKTAEEWRRNSVFASTFKNEDLKQRWPKPYGEKLLHCAVTRQWRHGAAHPKSQEQLQRYLSALPVCVITALEAVRKNLPEPSTIPRHKK